MNAATDTALELIAHLDFAPTCQWREVVPGTANVIRECGNEATWVVALVPCCAMNRRPTCATCLRDFMEAEDGDTATCGVCLRVGPLRVASVEPLRVSR